MEEIIEKNCSNEEDVGLILYCLVDKAKVGNPFNIVYIEAVLITIDFIIKLHGKKINLKKIFKIRSFVIELLPVSNKLFLMIFIFFIDFKT